MVDVIKQRHGTIRDFILNLVLLGVCGVAVIHIITVATYSLLPNEYFIKTEGIVVTNVDVCNNQQIQATGTRVIYPYLPDDIAKHKTLNANVHVELFSVDGRKIDDLQRTPVIEWKPDGKNNVQWQFNTTLLPGQYYIEMTTNLVLPVIGERAEPIRTRSNTFTVELCKPLQVNIKL